MKQNIVKQNITICLKKHNLFAKESIVSLPFTRIASLGPRRHLSTREHVSSLPTGSLVLGDPTYSACV